ncbi:MAG: bifunctional glutamate N-acetyltransferase/amino-acid acetyltransferase ArgJ [Candidatus Omnitrophica bacterium]|nr:bifunctional glutamate N-acetyltransferase/amino-acid acetyltransferase ArgJ [Candidatus Omnitrophota bacterium]
MKVPEGFLLSGINCGIKRGKRLDLGLIFCKNGAVACGFFTKNSNSSYSVVVSKKNIKNSIKALVVNSGNANCFTDKKDLLNTIKLCKSLARELNIKEENVLIASTGKIGQSLPFSKITKSLSKLCEKLNMNKRNIKSFAESILTTDTHRKISFREIEVKRKKIKILGFSKGAGMINPELATMLAFIITDAKITKSLLKNIAKEAVEESFNSISVDGCTSTNDSVIFLASKESWQVKDKQSIAKFKMALKQVCRELAKMIVKDGEGSTKFIQINIKGAKTQREAKLAFKAISSSVLFRASMYGKNPNWGRIVASLGQAGIKLSEDKFRVKTTPLKNREINIIVNLGRGNYSWCGWCCDITPNYININAKYN